MSDILKDPLVGPRTLEEVRAAVARRDAANRHWRLWRWWRGEDGRSAFERRLALHIAATTKNSALD